MKAFNYKIGVKTCADEIGIISDIMSEIDNQKAALHLNTNLVPSPLAHNSYIDELGLSNHSSKSSG